MNLCEMARIESALSDLLIYHTKARGEGEEDLAHLLEIQDYNKLLNLAKSKWSCGENLDLLFNEGPIERHFELTAVGVACLQLFVNSNWAGGHALATPPPFASENSDLTLDGADLASPLIKNLALFQAAKSILFHPKNTCLATLTLKWWQYRALNIHQQILSDPSETIFKKSSEMFREISAKMSENVGIVHQIHFYLESALFSDLAGAEMCVATASRLLGIELQKLGLLGKRTKFQNKNLPQLTLNIKRNKSSEFSEFSDINAQDLPSDIKLNDEVRLDKIAFSNSEIMEEEQLGISEICFVMTAFNLAKRSQPKDELFSEQLKPYLDTVLSNAKSCWAVKYSALLERSRLERDDRRAVERSLMQVQNLVDTLYQDKEKTDDYYNHRMNFFYCCKIPPFWSLETDLVHLLQSLGSTKTALDLALKLQLWEEVINCYHLLELKHKAAEVIRHQIEVEGESALLFCMLGDATDDPDHYRKAVELSNGKSARAFRSLGAYFFYKKEYQTAVEYYQKSLKLNSYQLGTLLRSGFAAMQVEMWEIAAQSYRDYCIYESDNFEAWNNLANTYIKMGQKGRAWKVLQEAVKCDYDNWKVWDNILVVSTDCAHFEEVIKAYHRLLDLKEAKHVDGQVLEILVKAINENLPDNYDRPSGKFRPAALKLFGRLTSANPSESQLWELYAYLVKGGESEQHNLGPEEAFKAAQLLQKATATHLQKSDWAKTVASSVKGIQLATSYGTYCLDFAQVCENKTRAIQTLASCKMTQKSALAKIKQTQLNDANGEMEKNLEHLEEMVQRVISTIDRLKS